LSSHSRCPQVSPFSALSTVFSFFPFPPPPFFPLYGPFFFFVDHFERRCLSPLLLWGSGFFLLTVFFRLFCDTLFRSSQDRYLTFSAGENCWRAFPPLVGSGYSPPVLAPWTNSSFFWIFPSFFITQLGAPFRSLYFPKPFGCGRGLSPILIPLFSLVCAVDPPNSFPPLWSPFKKKFLCLPATIMPLFPLSFFIAFAKGWFSTVVKATLLHAKTTPLRHFPGFLVPWVPQRHPKSSTLPWLFQSPRTRSSGHPVCLGSELVFFSGLFLFPPFPLARRSCDGVAIVPPPRSFNSPVLFQSGARHSVFSPLLPQCCCWIPR